MRITIISGSTRNESQSLEVSNYIKNIFTNTCEVSIIDLHQLNLPVYDDTGTGEWEERWKGVSQELEQSDGFVFVSPEWNGMFSPGLHNFFYYLKLELADKPVMLVAVSSGRGGRYPLVQMRAMGYKNKHFVIIPESVFVDHVKENLVEREMKNKFIDERMRYAGATLLEYAKALKLVQNSGVTDYEKFKNGW